MATFRLVVLQGLLLAACVAQPPSSSDPGTDPSAGGTDDTITDVCAGGRVHCYAKRLHRAELSGRSLANTPPATTPADLAKAYNFDPTQKVTATIGIVDAYGYPTLEADLAKFRSTYSLPPCTSASGCLKILAQDGSTNLPGPPPGTDDWTLETALDVDMASSACPSCNILVVQATTDQDNGLDIANSTAAAAGATVISNSWGGPYDQTADPQNETYFTHTGVAIFVAAGDDGYDDGQNVADYPSTSPHVIAVGGTTLTKDNSTRGFTETTWSSGGSSCQKDTVNFPLPSFQTGVVPATACKGRAASDVAALGDPNTGVMIYDNSGLSDGQGDTDNGLIGPIGGTSLASPLTASIFALEGHGNATAALPYANATAFNDVTSGTNGTCGTAMCEAGKGWDGPTGMGTPNGALLAAIAGGTGVGSGSDSGSDSGSGSDDGSGDPTTDGDGGTNGNADNGSSIISGGCSTSNGAGGAMVIVMLGLAITRRRRVTCVG
ncbi:MAG TPA: S53 family peptidase [Kofleriaceae bacterium]